MLENKYSNYYFNIVNNAKHRTTEGYVERHHIIPKSLGGSNDKDNIVALTAREHFICHWLLTKMTKGKDKTTMNYALWMMMNTVNEHQVNKRYKLNSKTYQNLKQSLSKVFSAQHKGKKLSAETRRKMSETRKRKIASGEIKVNENKEKYKIIAEKRKGFKVSQETRDKIGKAHKGKTISKEQREYLRKLNTGKKHTQETRDKISNALREQYKNGTRGVKA